MNCGTWVLWRDARRKGTGTPYRKAIRWYHSGFDRTAIPDDELPKLEICTGRVTATIAAIEEPDWGSVHAQLDVTYLCDTCKGTCFPHLPDTAEALSRFVTDAIAAK